jgi:hypothetical protein
MNDQSSGLPHEPPDDDPEGDRRQLAASVQRRLMEQRARLAAARARIKSPSRWLEKVLALIAALIVVLIVTLGFDAFLTSMQKVMRMMDEQEQRQEAERKKNEPIPAYVVPPESPPQE